MRKGPIPRTCKTCSKPFSTWPFKIRAGEGNYCSRKCAKKPKDPVRVFWSHVDKSGDCWKWLGTTTTDTGYGRFTSVLIEGEILAHRFSYELHKGPIPDGLFICHSCDNPSCVNPDHLFAKTQKQNLEEMVVRGRSLKGDKNPSRLHPERLHRGEQSHNAKLKEWEVREIRKRYAAKVASGWKLAKIFHISYPTIKDILSFRTWKHVV